MQHRNNINSELEIFLKSEGLKPQIFMIMVHLIL